MLPVFGGNSAENISVNTDILLRSIKDNPQELNQESKKNKPIKRNKTSIREVRSSIINKK